MLHHVNKATPMRKPQEFKWLYLSRESSRTQVFFPVVLGHMNGDVGRSSPFLGGVLVKPCQGDIWTCRFCTS